MNLNHILQTHELYQSFCQARDLQNQEKFAESLALVDKILASKALLESGDPSNARIHFMYLRAIALDMAGRLDEALPIFIELVVDYPGTPEFEASLQVVCNKLETRVKELIRNSPDHPEIRQIFDLLERYTFPPFWLIHAVAAQEAAEGKIEQAWKRMENLLVLSPNDADYLRCALAAAKAFGKANEHQRLVGRIEGLLEERPYRLDLAGLVKEGD